MTERLFWLDPYQRCFEARVLRRTVVDGHPAVVLDATCFYPTSGGQPHDTGRLNDIAVLDVIESGPEILHVLAQELHEDAVRGVVDWERRWDHMQQHAGQHILSAAFERALGAQTLSFHLGPEASSIDLDLPTLSPEALDEVEDLANQVIMEGRPIEVAQYDETAIAAVPLRKPPQVKGLIRVVSVSGWDNSACGGTHPCKASEVGLVHVERWESHRGGSRVTFLCGLRALRDYRHKSRLVRALAACSSVAVDELPTAWERLEEAVAEAQREAARLRAQLLAWQAPALAAEAEQVGPWRLVCRLLPESDSGEMRQLATQLAQGPGMLIALGVQRPAPQFCLARSADVDLDMVALAAELAAPYGGRGGGRPHLAQGGGLSEEGLSLILQDARRRLAREANLAQGIGE